MKVEKLKVTGLKTGPFRRLNVQTFNLVTFEPIMQLDDKICYCYSVSMRKLVNFSRRNRTMRPSQMTGCLGAGTGCGWCIPFLIKIAEDPDAFGIDDITPEQYAEQRSTYRKTEPRNTFERSAGESKAPGA